MLLSPGEEARVGNRQMLSMMIGVFGQGGQLAGLARLTASSLHWGLAAGRTDSLVVAVVKLAEVVQEGERWWGSCRWGCGLAHWSTWRG